MIYIQYCPLLQRRFQIVEIDIRDDMGSIVPFERGRVVVTLHCGKRKEFTQNTRVIISPSLPSTGMILNNGTWASPTIRGSSKGSELQKHLVLLPDGY
jgi:hypothetical protein